LFNQLIGDEVETGGKHTLSLTAKCFPTKSCLLRNKKAILSGSVCGKEERETQRKGGEAGLHDQSRQNKGLLRHNAIVLIGG
jgi:hypothetical protein